MAQVRGGIGQALSGKLEGIVYVQFNGGTYTRKAPVRSKDSWTPAMLLHQKRFGEVSRFCKQFKYGVIPQIWNGATNFSKVSNFGKVSGKVSGPRMSGYALFLKTNMPAFAMDGSLADPKMLQFSTGKLPLPQQFKAERTAVESTTIAVSWNNDPYLEPQRLTDHLMAISAGNGNYSYLTSTGLVRGAKNGSFELPPHPIGATHLYLFFASADKNDYTASVCFEI